jgi:hypothetical protein
MPNLPQEFEATVKLCKKSETIDYESEDEDGDGSSCSFEVKELTVNLDGMQEMDDEEGEGESDSGKKLESNFLIMVADAMGKKK